MMRMGLERSNELGELIGEPSTGELQILDS